MIRTTVARTRRSWLSVALVAALCLGLAACSDDDETQPRATGGTGGAGGQAGSGGVVGGGGTGGTGGSAAPCAEGAISSACLCEGEVYQSGYCCSEYWFSPHYEGLSGGCPSGTFYVVDQNHPQASDTGPGTADEPWLTIERAVWGSTDRDSPAPGDALGAGDVVIVMPGTYLAEGASGERWDPWWRPINSGTAGSPIIIKAHGDVALEAAPEHEGTAQGANATTIQLADTASTDDDAYQAYTVRISGGTGAGQVRVIQGSPAYVGATRTATIASEAGQEWDTVPDATSTYELRRRGALIGAQGTDYVVWDGFGIDTTRYGYAADTGPAVLMGPSGCAFLHLQIDGHNNYLTDNFNGIRVEGATDTLVASNRIHGIRRFDGSHNGAGIMTYGVVNLVIENNDFADCTACVFPKGHDNVGVTIRYNRFDSCDKAVRTTYTADLLVYQNVMTNSGMGLQIAENSANAVYANNTIVGGQSGIWVRAPDLWQNVVVRNNIVSGAETAINAEEVASIPNATIDYQDYFDNTQFRWDWNDVTFTEWTSLSGFDGHSITEDPLFTNVAGGDFSLQAGSPAVDAGIDVLDLNDNGATDDAITLGAIITGNETIGPFGPR